MEDELEPDPEAFFPSSSFSDFDIIRFFVVRDVLLCDESIGRSEELYNCWPFEEDIRFDDEVCFTDATSFFCYNEVRLWW